jgi:hypothetical protein
VSKWQAVAEITVCCVGVLGFIWGLLLAARRWVSADVKAVLGGKVEALENRVDLMAIQLKESEGDHVLLLELRRWVVDHLGWHRGRDDDVGHLEEPNHRGPGGGP